ncbi:MAG TPA: Rieske 2Fe-2S domain-containing protein, partial [Dehalococcoidia bacterium]|nr:Rieske 2Fe-2S domain-containing protein [Dehalococcoidia bacterium]
KEILVANVDGAAYAIADRCTHLRYRLHKGTLDGTVVTCQGHGSRFDVPAGGLCNRVTPPLWYRLLMDATFPGFLKRGVQSYATRVEGDDVYVEL